jgi:hypothetical protein
VTHVISHCVNDRCLSRSGFDEIHVWTFDLAMSNRIVVKMIRLMYGNVA